MGEELNTAVLAPSKPATSATDESPGDNPGLELAIDPARLPALDAPAPPPLDLAGPRARGRKRWTFGAAILTAVAVAVSLWAVSARADETSHILTLTDRLDTHVTSASASSHDLTAMIGTAERVYEYSDGQVADPVTREILAESLTEARAAAAQRVTDAPPTSVTQARTLITQAANIESSLDWATDDLRVAVDLVQQSQGAQRALDSREPVGNRTILTSRTDS